MVKKKKVKKRGKRLNKKSEGNFIEGAKKLLNSIGESKKELRILKNQQLESLNIKERKEIKLIKEKTKKQRAEILKRYEKGKEDLGNTLLKRKKQELGTRLSIEKTSLSKTHKGIRKVGKSLRDVRE
jgi:hypothetical protein